MSTEATGDGRPEAVDATEPGAGTEVAAPAADESADDSDPEYAGDESDPEYADDEVPESDEYDDDEAPEYDEDYEYDEADDAYAAEEATGDVEDYEPDEDFGEAEDVEDVEARRARRWPRVLLAGGFVVLAAAIVGGAIAIVGSVTHGFKKPVKVTYKTSAVFSLKTGDCFDPQGPQSYTLVSCDTPHDAEVFATFALTGATWPGASAVQAEASGGCAGRLTGYVNPQLAISLTSTYVYPDSVAWQAGTRAVICEVRATSGQLTGSVRGASATAG